MLHLGQEVTDFEQALAGEMLQVAILAWEQNEVPFEGQVVAAVGESIWMAGYTTSGRREKTRKEPDIVAETYLEMCGVRVGKD